MTKVTTSWDDGDVLDTKVAALLDKYALKGTFYITKNYRSNPLRDDQLRQLHTRHEIGGHTLSHPDLRKSTRDEKVHEIKGGKEWLENVLGKELAMFCYPSGRFDAESAAVARAAGFKGARTTEMGKIAFQDAFSMSTTLSVYPMPFRKIDANSFHWRHLFEPLHQRSPIFRKLGVSYLAMRSFESLACAAFDIAHEKGGVYHLWGHSWEIEKYGMWDELERVLRYIGKRSDCEYFTNGELV